MNPLLLIALGFGVLLLLSRSKASETQQPSTQPVFPKVPPIPSDLGVPTFQLPPQFRPIAPPGGLSTMSFVSPDDPASENWVLQLQRVANRIGLGPVPEDGDFQSVGDLVQKFQAWAGLPVGPNNAETLAAIESVYLSLFYPHGIPT